MLFVVPGHDTRFGIVFLIFSVSMATHILIFIISKFLDWMAVVACQRLLKLKPFLFNIINFSLYFLLLTFKFAYPFYQRFFTIMICNFFAKHSGIATIAFYFCHFTLRNVMINQLITICEYFV